MNADELIQTQKSEQGSKDCPKVAIIIILNWNGWRDTIECLESLQRLTYPNYQIIVMDNGSTDDSVEKIKAWAQGEIPVESKFFEYNPELKPIQLVEYDRQIAEAGGDANKEDNIAQIASSRKLVLISTGKNLGFSAGNNVALRYVLQHDYPYISLLNNDTIVAPDYLEKLVVTLEENSRYWVASPKILFKEDPNIIWYAGGRLRLPLANRRSHIGIHEIDGPNWQDVRDNELITGCAFLAKAELFRSIGLFDEDYFFYHEDAAFSIKAQRHGFKLCVVLDSKVYHKWSGSIGNQTIYSCYYGNKYRLVLLKKEGGIVEKMSGYTF